MSARVIQFASRHDRDRRNLWDREHHHDCGVALAEPRRCVMLACVHVRHSARATCVRVRDGAVRARDAVCECASTRVPVRVYSGVLSH